MNRKLLVLAATIAISLVVPSCTVIPKPAPQAHTSQNSLDWQGTYSGVLPCAGCAGRAIQLSLSNDGIYTLNGQYSCTFTWQGNTIILFDVKGVGATHQYKVGENQLIAVDSSNALADKYILKKVIPMSIENKKWQLVELNYQAVKGTAQTHYLILNSATQRLETKAGCNQMGGAYAIKNGTELMIKQLMSTVMACENMLTEMDFYTALSTADNFSVFNNQLFLNKKMISLARFDLVVP